MMKRFRLLLITAAMVLITAFTAYAAFSANVSFSDPKAKVGEDVSVSMKIRSSGGNLGSATIMLNYDPAYLEFTGGDYAQGGAGTVKVTGDSSLGQTEWAYSLKFKALSPGTTTITMDDSWEIYDDSQNMAALDHKGSSAITIEGDSSSSINANLSSLKISPGILTPDFAPEVAEYTTQVGGDCTKLTVSASTADSNAKVIISGNADLQLGENVVICQVTAQDGTTVKEYTIKVDKIEGSVDYGQSSGILTANVNGEDYEVAETFDDTMLPQGFISQTVNYRGRDVLSGLNEKSGLTIMYLIGNNGSGDFFVYDAASDLWSPFAQITTTEKAVTVVPMGSDVAVPEGFAETTLELNGKKVHGWIWSGDLEQEYCMIYGMNADGEKNFYRYDMKEKTIQRFFSNPAAVDQVDTQEYIDAANKYNELIKDYNLRGYIVLALGIIAGILLVALIIVLITSRGNGSDDDQQGRRGDRRNREDDDEGLKAQARAQRAKEREMRKRRQEAEERPYDEAEERYMRGVEEDQEEEPVPPKNGKTDAQSPIPTEEELQMNLARDVQKTTEPKDIRTTEELLEDDGFETFEI
ncbi:MAG: cadherin-like beta sandwich domain-containing protein [Lachnospiraceae bacterium]|nr:cadherin-like beta sandwich domain-containing protein [Lachnospiraceae bacterium]